MISCLVHISSNGTLGELHSVDIAKEASRVVLESLKSEARSASRILASASIDQTSGEWALDTLLRSSRALVNLSKGQLLE